MDVVDIYDYSRLTKLKNFIKKFLYQSIGAVTATCIFSYYTLDWLIFHIHKPFWIVENRKTEPAILQDVILGQHKIHKINNGIQIHYVEKGDTSNPLILFVHGFPEGWISWRYQIEQLAKDFWVIAPDLRGYGKSSKPKGVDNYRLSLIVEDLRDLIMSKGKNTIHVVGHDWGGYISWCFISMYPHLVKSYVLINSATREAMIKIYKVDRFQQFKSWYMIFFHLPYFPELYMRANNFKSLKKFGYSQNYNEDSFVNVYKYLFHERDAYTCPINYYRANLVSNPIHKLFKPKNEIEKIPGMVLWGTGDIFLSEKIVELICEELPNVRSIKLKGGHFIHQEKPDVVNNHLKHFFKNINYLQQEHLHLE